ncbi:hypothetical protein M1116_03510 [Patescibacteria group bacterium]|nr:hypothetical protein [Patescibacteria group bacterium]
MQLLKQPQTEQEYWECLYSLGSSLYATEHDLCDGRIDDPDGEVARDQSQGYEIGRRLISEACDKFGLIHPNDIPRNTTGQLPPLPPGKKMYFNDWLQAKRREWLTLEYHKTICSGCILSEGLEEFILREGGICCSLSHSLGILVHSDTCDLVEPIWDDHWSRRRLLTNIRARGGQAAVIVFRQKEAELKTAAKNT